MTKTELQAAIYAAFDEVQYPGDGAIAYPERPDGLIRYDGEGINEEFQGRDWRSMSTGYLWSEALCFMREPAFHYYFPAYMLRALENYHGEENEAVLHYITPDHLSGFLPQYDYSSFEARFTPFTPAQRQCIVKFIRYSISQLIALGSEEEPNFVPGSEVYELLQFWEKF